MSRTYTLAILIAVVLCGGIAAYHFLQSNQNDPQIKDQGSPSADSSKKPADGGLGDLMSRIRHRMDSANPPATTAEDATTAAAPTVDQATRDQASVETQKTIDATDAPSTTLTLSHETPSATTQSPSTAPVPTVPGTSPADSAPPTPTPTIVADDGPTPRDLTHISIATINDRTPRIAAVADRADKAAATPRSTPMDYTVRPGDTYSSIAIKMYGAEQYWLEIAAANPFVNPDKLQVGQVIRLPSPDEVMASRASKPEPAAVAAAKNNGLETHVVQPGETLTQIAQQHYHDAGLWRVIFDANRDAIGPTPDSLRAGTTLVIPRKHVAPPPSKTTTAGQNH